MIVPNVKKLDQVNYDIMIEPLYAGRKIFVKKYERLDSMKIAVVHGYLLRGTGSNLYVSNLCRTFCRQGHQVLLFSQEEETEAFDFISSSEAFKKDNQKTTIIFERSTPYSGSCRHFRPNLANNINAVLSYLEGITEDERAQLARRAHNLAEEHFSWDKIAANCLEL